MPGSRVENDEVEIRIYQPDGKLERLAWADLRAVLVETNASGPIEPDWFWILVGQSGECVISGETMGGETLLEVLQKLPGFDNEAFIEAMSCVEARRFVCWKQSEPPVVGTEDAAG